MINLDVGGSYTYWSRNYIGNLSSSELLEIRDYPDNETAQADLAKGDVEAVIIIPQDFGESCNSFRQFPENPGLWINATVHLYVDSGSMIATQAIPPIIQQILAGVVYTDQPVSLPMPIRVGSPSLVEARKFTTFDYFVPGLFAYAAIFLIMTVGESFTTDREKGLLRRIHTTPTTATEFISGHVLSNMAAAVLQVAIIFCMAFIIGYRPEGDASSLVLAFIIVLVFSLCSVGFGLITATIAKSPGAATGISFLFILPQMFLGTFMGFALSPGMQSIARFVPSWYVTDALTTLFIRGAPVTSPSVLSDLGVVVIWSMITLIVGILLFGKYGKA